MPQTDPDPWPSPSYWLVWTAAGVAIYLFTNGRLGIPQGPDGVLGMWLASILLSAGAAVVGCILAVFQRARLIGIASLAAGLGGLAAGLFWFA